MRAEPPSDHRSWPRGRALSSQIYALKTGLHLGTRSSKAARTQGTHESVCVKHTEVIASKPTLRQAWQR